MTRRSLIASLAGVGSCWGERPITGAILADAKGRIVRENWPGGDQAVSFGSLLKPFLAISYLHTGAEPPVLECGGAAAGCWLSGGHGQQDLITALANSCNVYFRWIAARLNSAALETVCLSYGLTQPGREWDPSRLIGLGPGWPQKPEAVVAAFAALCRSPIDPHGRTALMGMAQCARNGTGQGIACACYAKTGTAACSHSRNGLADGFTVAMYPLEQPRRVALVVRHNATGATAARDARQLLFDVG